jgi:hypothetical protein
LLNRLLRGIVWVARESRIALYFTGCEDGGENLAEVLKQRATGLPFKCSSVQRAFEECAETQRHAGGQLQRSQATEVQQAPPFQAAGVLLEPCQRRRSLEVSVDVRLAIRKPPGQLYMEPDSSPRLAFCFFLDRFKRMSFMGQWNRSPLA